MLLLPESSDLQWPKFGLIDGRFCRWDAHLAEDIFFVVDECAADPIVLA